MPIALVVCVKMKRECQTNGKHYMYKRKSQTRYEKKSTEQEEAHFVSRVTVILIREKERERESMCVCVCVCVCACACVRATERARARVCACVSTGFVPVVITPVALWRCGDLAD